MNARASNTVIDENPPQAVWYGSSKVVMLDSNELFRMQQDITTLRTLHSNLQQSLNEYEISHLQNLDRIDTLECVFKEQLTIEFQKAAKQQQDLRMLLARKDLEHLKRIQELESQMSELKIDYEQQIEVLRKRVDTLENKDAVEQQRIENYFIRTHQSFPFSLASSTGWLTKWQNSHNNNNNTSNNVIPKPEVAATLSSVNAVTSAISSILNNNNSRNSK